MSCRKNIASSHYDRQLKIEMFKRIHGTNFGLISKVSAPVLGPTSYNPKTMEEIYQGKPCSKYGSFYQQSPRFPSTTGKSKHRCASNVNDLFHLIFGVSSICRREICVVYGRFPMKFFVKTNFNDVSMRFDSIVKLLENRVGRKQGVHLQ